ncbi:MAG: DNA replication/repair protein RecF [Leptospiraceae bacterium]|nr:DNA replication/repair protein RecF [Leptospiraceae bacterium]
MILKRIVLKNFRTYKDLSLEFHSRLIFFIGDNGEGKTNLLESISLLSFLKSFRGNSDDEMLMWNENTFYIGSLCQADDDFKLEYGFEKEPIRRKKIKLNNDIFKKQSDAFGLLPCVVLSPKDLIIIEGSHAERRKFIDSLISLLHKPYLDELLEYNRILKQRNITLKKQFNDLKMIDVYNSMLADKDESIRNKRKEIIEELNFHYQKALGNLSGGKDNFTLIYKPNVDSKEKFLEKIQTNYQKDIRLGYTTVGSHRDEIFIGRDDKDILEFGSQGQKRSSVISLKTASFELIRKKIGTDPILLIDDVIRELDIKRREFFVDLIRECGQAFFTTTDLEGIQDYIGNLDESRQIYHVKNGSMVESK